MEWDKIKVAQRFLQQANAIHPDEMTSEHDRIDAMARQDLLYDCYMSSFSRESLAKRLDEVIAGVIEIPDEDDMDEDRYRQRYMHEARLVQGAIQRGEIK